jgi:lysozyme family protein
MANFVEAVTLTLKHEGGYVDNPSDPGGATNMGIEQRDLPNIPIRTLTVAQATSYYEEHYWKPLYADITSSPVCDKLFDWGVLFGVGTAVEVLQQVLDVKVDGDFGQITLDAVNAAADDLLAFYKEAMMVHAKTVVARNPSLSVFLIGWLNRINS